MFHHTEAVSYISKKEIDFIFIRLVGCLLYRVVDVLLDRLEHVTQHSFFKQTKINMLFPRTQSIVIDFYLPSQNV